MPTYHPPLDSPELLHWSQIQETDVVWRGLLLGNGASMAVAPSFSYGSLLAVAEVGGIEHPLQGPARQLFADLSTSNFEFVLASLKLAGRVCRAAGVSAPSFPQLYEEIQQALFEAVAEIHVDWDSVAATTLPRIRAELLQYKSIFSTNYDLLVYWAMMRDGDPDDFRDFFWQIGGPFDPTNVDVWGSPTVVYFLHGAVHLRRTQGGGTYKQTASEQNLLSQFRTDWQSDETPLLVSEGTSADKLRSINASDYLSFAYGALGGHLGNLVIFGHGLGDQDEHLVHAINNWDSPAWNRRQIGVSIRGSQRTESEIRQEKARLARLLPHADLWFYEADSHPLGEPQVNPD